MSSSGDAGPTSCRPDTTNSNYTVVNGNNKHTWD